MNPWHDWSRSWWRYGIQLLSPDRRVVWCLTLTPAGGLERDVWDRLSYRRDVLGD